MPLDASFYFVAVPVVLMMGLSKGGMGDVLGMLAVPLLALVVSPVQAAAILLPILIVMDVAALWSWRGSGDTKLLRLMLPGALIGIAIGWATSAMVPDYVLRLIIGLVALSFAIRYFYNRFRRSETPPRQHNRVKAGFWSLLAGYSSFVAHAGGPPYQVYALPLRLPPKDYTGTAVKLFAIINAVKLIPYFMLGQLNTTNLAISATLFPIAPLATIAGAYMVRRMRPEVFYPFMYTMCALAGLKLTRDGLMPLIDAAGTLF